MKSDVDVTAEMRDAERKAWAALARYKFWMFGYHAADWINLNRRFNAKRSNPFAELVRLAREKGKA